MVIISSASLALAPGLINAPVFVSATLIRIIFSSAVTGEALTNIFDIPGQIFSPSRTPATIGAQARIGQGKGVQILNKEEEFRAEDK